MGDDYYTTLGGLKVLKDDAVPSVFPLKTPVNQPLSKKSSCRMGKEQEKTLCVHCRFEGTDNDIHFYSGFQNVSSYREFINFVLRHAENMSYWSRTLHENLPDGDEASTKTGNVSTGQTNIALLKKDKLFWTLARLHLGLPLQHIANLFNVSIATV